MSETIHNLIEQYGLFAIFLGCVAEGESAAIAGGFFAHQRVLVGWQVVLAAFVGSFLGDTLFFLVGKYFSTSQFVQKLQRQPAFAYACRMVRSYPTPYVLLNRYVYGFRLIGGVVAGLSDIGFLKFTALNGIAAAIWACLFVTIGYVFGAGAEQVIGASFAQHERLIFGVCLSLFAATLGWWFFRSVRRRLKS